MTLEVLVRSIRNSAHSWGLVSISLHWLTALLLLLVLGTGWWAEHRAGGQGQRILYEVHFSLGLVTLALMLVRLSWRLLDPRPALPTGLTQLHRLASHIVHGLLHLCALAALISGAVIFWFLGPVRVFGVLNAPRLLDPATQEPLRALAWYVHYYVYWLLLLLVVGHVAAALHHQLVRRDRLLSDFWFGDPGRKHG